MFMGIKRWFKHNLLLKILALIIGVVVWFIASRWVYETSTLVVPVELKLAPGMILTSLEPEKITVILEYPRESHSMIEEGKGDIKLIHDLSGDRDPGRINFEIQAADLTRPARFRIISLNPPRITAEVDRRVEKVLPIKVVYRGSPRRGYRVAGQRVIPPEVRVPGAETILKDMTEIETEPINVMGREITFDTKAILSSLSPFSAGKEEKVTVIVVLRPELQQRSFEDIKVDILKSIGASNEIQIIPGKVDLYLRGSDPVMNSLSAEDIRVYIDLIDLKPGTWELPLHTAFPSGISLDRADPEIIKVIIAPGPDDLLGPGSGIK